LRTSEIQRLGQSNSAVRLRPVLVDPNWPEAERPNVVGRQKFGRITIANTDSGATAYTDVAIDQAYRAVQERMA
jgi:spermidine dehydrogenase